MDKQSKPDNKKRSDSDSSVQTRLEDYLVDEYEKSHGFSGIHNADKIWLNPSTYIVPDIYSEKHQIIGEVHVHTKKLRSAQKDKLASDILKMVLFEKEMKVEYEKVLLICGLEEKAYLEGDSYIADAIRQYKIKIEYIELTVEQQALLEDTVKKQDLSKH